MVQFETKNTQEKRMCKEAREAKRAYPSAESGKATDVAKKVTKKSTSKERPDSQPEPKRKAQCTDCGGELQFIGFEATKPQIRDMFDSN